MRRLALAAALGASMLALPAAAVASPDLPPRDVVIIEGGNQGCQPDYPCDIEPFRVTVDKTYPSRLVAWVKEQG